MNYETVPRDLNKGEFNSSAPNYRFYAVEFMKL